MHGGAAAFTVGQRRGLGVAAKEPLYVEAVEPGANRVRVAPRAALLRHEVRFGPIHAVDVDPSRGAAGGPYRVEARIRHAMAPVPGELTWGTDGTGTVRFDEPVFAPAPGQALVAYRGDAVLCGGPILMETGLAVTGLAETREPLG